MDKLNETEGSMAFKAWMEPRLSKVTTATYDTWRRNMIKDHGEDITAESVAKMYNRRPYPPVRGMLLNLMKHIGVKYPLPEQIKKKGSKLPDTFDSVTRDKIIDHMTPRYSLITQLMYECGLRITEATNLRFINLRPSEGRIQVTGKGSRERIVYPSNVLMSNILKNFRMEKNNPEEYLFPSPKVPGQPVRGITIRRHMNKIIRKAKPHTLRHTAATDMLRSGENIKTIQRFLGHSNVSTTSIYTHVYDEEVEKANKKLWRSTRQ